MTTATEKLADNTAKPKRATAKKPAASTRVHLVGEPQKLLSEVATSRATSAFTGAILWFASFPTTRRGEHGEA